MEPVRSDNRRREQEARGSKSIILMVALTAPSPTRSGCSFLGLADDFVDKPGVHPSIGEF